jgi:hypothetical protein
MSRYGRVGTLNPTQEMKPSLVHLSDVSLFNDKIVVTFSFTSTWTTSITKAVLKLFFLYLQTKI